MELSNMWQDDWKYNWDQIVNRAKSKHRSFRKQSQKRIPKGPHIQTENDTAIRRATDFGFIRITINGNNSQNENEWAKEFTRCKFGVVFLRNGGIIGHIAWKQHEIGKITDLNFHYCPGAFSSSATLKKQIYPNPAKNSKQIRKQSNGNWSGKTCVEEIKQTTTPPQENTLSSGLDNPPQQNIPNKSVSK